MIYRAAAAALLALTVAIGACASGDGPGRTATKVVNVKLHDSRFVPDHFEFEVGTTVTFVVENTDPIDHEFIIGDESVQQAHEEGTEEHHGAKPGELSIPIGETRRTSYTFDEPGTLLIGCHLPSHYDFGMKGEITVNG
ncbi:MAG: cupredoxin domain-containing protein [Actinomycetota bacterium]|nr:cupredoxin domain-containing protein [Actinomycetota bacterium]